MSGEPKPGRSTLEQEVEDAVDKVGRFGLGVVGHLFGARAVGREEAELPSATPGVDDAIDAVGDTLGKVLNAVGTGLKEHPVDPEQAARTMGEQLRDPGPAPKNPGWSRLTTGLGALAQGLGTVTGHVVEELGAATGKVVDELGGGRPKAPAEPPTEEAEEKPGPG